MTTPARTDRQPNEVIDNDDINQLALVANRADSTARAAQADADAALEAALGAYTMPPDGVAYDDLPPGTVIVRRVTGGAWTPRPTASLNVVFAWTRVSVSEPAVPIGTVSGQLYAIVGHDFVDFPPA